MPYFDRFDICAAYRQLEMDWNRGGILEERPTCLRRNQSVGHQLARIGYKPEPGWMGSELSENAWAIYHHAAARMGITG